MDQPSHNLLPPNPISKDGSQYASPSTLDIQEMAHHSFNSTNPQVGKISRHKGLGLPGRLAAHGTYGGRSLRSHQSNDLTFLTFGLVVNFKKSHNLVLPNGPKRQSNPSTSKQS
ncbi:predicted protein [Lichtheimia corymbifera JMRC:FSU:9682]|uniref:Uncharacterized protein n=1 Tax=Lichtheimia corymbifera JMRC:FSU:9682 TaxID=1263082 RepID=A0A068SFP9_9FUNG|nr:predicted protein [Lichtheimia corymbifera JMRC:FSU:9682]